MMSNVPPNFEILYMPLFFSIHFCFALKSFLNFSLSASIVSSSFKFSSIGTVVIYASSSSSSPSPSSSFSIFFSLLFSLLYIFYVLVVAITVVVVLLCSAHSGRRLVVLSSPFGHSGLCPAIPAASAVFRPFRPFRPLSGHSGSGHCSVAPAVFRPSPSPSLLVWPSSSIRMSPSAGRFSLWSCLSGCLALVCCSATLRPPTILGRRSVRL